MPLWYPSATFSPVRVNGFVGRDNIHVWPGAGKSTLTNGLVRFVDANSTTDLKTGDSVTLAGSAISTTYGDGRSLSTSEYISTSWASGTDFSSGLTVAWYGRSVGAWDVNQDCVRIDDGTNAIYLRPQWMLMDTSSGLAFSPPFQFAAAADTFVWLIGTYNGSSAAVFRHNTTIKESYAASGSLTLGATTMYVGNFTNSADATANYTKFGLLWNRVLTGDEITELIATPYNAVLP